MIMHPGYPTEPVDPSIELPSQNPADWAHNDIAILKLAEPFVFNDIVQPACLPTNDSTLKSGDWLRVSGYGNTGNFWEDIWFAKLRLVDVPFHKDKVCARNMGKFVSKNIQHKTGFYTVCIKTEKLSSILGSNK